MNTLRQRRHCLLPSDAAAGRAEEEAGLIGELAASSFPPALHGHLEELVGRFDGSGVFPVFVLLRDGYSGFGLFRWMHFGAELETLATSTLDWPTTLTVITADGAGTSLHLEKRGWLQ